jgi:hypothetical protein
LESGPLSSDEFEKFAQGDDVVLFLHNTSRVEDEPYPTLLTDMGFRGFPSLAVLDAEGNKLAEPAGRSVASFEKTVKAAKAYVELNAKAKAEPENDKLQKQLFFAELDLGKLDFDEAKQKAAELKSETFTEAEKKRLAAALANLEVSALLQSVMATGQADDGTRKRLLELQDQESLRENTQYWGFLINFAITDGDLALFDKAAKRLLESLDEATRKSVEPRIEQARKMVEQNAGKKEDGK